MSSGNHENTLRNMEIYEKRMRGASLADLAGQYGLDDSRISTICKEVRRTLPEQSREDLVAASMEQMEYLRKKVIELANMAGAPVTVGQLGEILREPETDEVVRDYSLRLRAIELARKLWVDQGKRLGLDAPTESVVKASVQYEIVGIDPETLT